MLLVGVPAFILFLYFPNVIVSFFSYEYGGYTSNTIGFLNIHTSDNWISSRYSGFASEPGLLSTYICLALYSRTVKNYGNIDKYSMLMILAIFLSKSTAGIISMLFILLINLNRKQLLLYLFLLVFLMLRIYIKAACFLTFILPTSSCSYPANVLI